MLYPALEVEGVDADMALAVIDDYSPTAVEQLDTRVTVYFADSADRDRARTAVGCVLPHAVMTARDVDDEGWARRSQENLQPVSVGRITIVPNLSITKIGVVNRCADNPPPPIDNPQSLIPDRVAIVIQPSMGFGTGHHASTRLCLAAIQRVDLNGLFVLDIGTGSGVLAIAASRLGAASVLGIDNDPDAVRSAMDNLSLNAGVEHLRFEVADLKASALPRADVITANLTGALLIRAAARVLKALRARGTLILGGLLEAEERDVAEAFAALTLVGREQEEEWLCLAFREGPPR
jgi:ribosomal protein L11 methyltransferase